MAIVMAVELDSVSYKLFLLQELFPFLWFWLSVIVLMLRHLHAQDCLNWKLEKTFFCIVTIKMYLFQEISSL